MNSSQTDPASMSGASVNGAGVNGAGAELCPATMDELIQILSGSSSGNRIIVGTCSADEQALLQARHGQSVERLSLRQLNKVVDYPARDMTITVEAGMTIGELRRVLVTEQQQLPIDVHSDVVTVGAMVAADMSGPRRNGYGTVRDYLIGMEAVDGTGRVYHAGGRVVKNVAGYDFCRLVTGARGRTGVLTRVTFKLKPIPASAVMCVVACPALDVLDRLLNRLNLSVTRPVVMDVLNPAAWRMLEQRGAIPATESNSAIDHVAAFLLVGFDGAEGVCRWQTEALQDEVQSEGCRMMELTGRGFETLVERSQKFAAAQRPDSETAVLCRLITRPSSVVAALNAGTAIGAEVFGRAGQGVLYFRLSADSRLKSGKGQGELRSQLSQFVSDGIGGLSVYESGQGNVSLGGSANVSLVQKLLLAFDPGQKFAF